MERPLGRIREALRRYFVAGILAFAPIAITIWAISWIIQRLDNLLLPRVLALLMPGLEEPPQIPLVGALFTLFVILLMGFAFWNDLSRSWDDILGWFKSLI